MADHALVLVASIFLLCVSAILLANLYEFLALEDEVCLFRFALGGGFDASQVSALAPRGVSC
jgi:hypothetical protein